MMRKTLFQTLLLLLVSLTSSQVMAQDDDGTVGYAKVNVAVKAAYAGSGKVYASAKAATVKAWREEVNFNNAVQVGSYMDSYVAVFYLYEKPADTYSFAGWYLDDGDGVFDLDKDAFIDDAEELYYTMVLDDDAQIYDTEAAAKNGTGPTEPTELVWAYFTRGAKVAMSAYQGDDYDFYAHCGAVWNSKPVNEPGDEITVEAIANDGYHFEYWADAYELGNVVSRENPYTFTVKGGERLFAYFVADDAPEVDLPEEGGFAVLNTEHAWFLTDESLKNGAHVLVMLTSDFRRDEAGRTYLDMNVEDSHVDVAQTQEPTIVYGKGKVRFSFYLRNISFSREMVNLVQWSGTKGVSVGGDVIYVYVFVPELGAFIQYGTTDDFNPKATSSVKVPAGLAYFYMSAFDLTDDEGNIPTVIGFSPETYDKGVAGGPEALEDFIRWVTGIDHLQMDQRTLQGQKVYTLTGVEVKPTPVKGIYIVNGKKVMLK